MDPDAAVRLLDRLHAAQNEFYAGGSDPGFDRLLTPDIIWVVPGENRIAGTYRGLPAVLDYFRARRALADRTFRMTRHDVLVGEGERIAALTDGSATVWGRPRHWSTVGLYEIRAERVAACWLLPIDPAAFDAIWR